MKAPITRNNLLRCLVLHREAARRAARRDVNGFVEAVLKDDRGNPVRQAVIHRLWHRHIDRCFARRQMCGILAPWGHGKTEQAVIARVLRMIGENPAVRIKIVCNGDENAQARVAAIGRYITDDPDFRAVYPHVKPASGRSWSRHSLTVARRSRAKDPTIEAYGILAGGIGGRCDVLIADDPVDLRNAVTMPALRRQVAEAFRNVWLSRLEPDGRVIYIATRWHMADLTGELMENSEFQFLQMKIADDFSHIDVDDPFAKGIRRVPLWTERWNEIALRRRCAQIGMRAFDRGFRQNPLSDEELLFTREMIEGCFDYTLTARDLEPAQWATYVGVDLAGTNRNGNVIFVLGIAPDGTRVPLEALCGQWNSPETAKKILEINRRYRPQIIAVENNAYQQSLLDWMAQMGAADVPVRPFTTHTNKSNPQIGIPSLAVEFANRAWKIPVGLRSHSAACDCWTCRWIEEMLNYPLGKSSDILMASWFAREAARAADAGTIHFGKLPDLY